MRYVPAGDGPAPTSPAVSGKIKKTKLRSVPSGNRRPYGPIIGAFVV